MASKRKPFTFYDTFNDTFDSNRGHRKISVPESPIINFTVLQAPEIDSNQTQFFLPGGCVLRCAIVIGVVEAGLADDVQHEALHVASGEADRIADQDTS